MRSESTLAGPSLQDPRPTVQDLLADPAVRAPLKAVLRSWCDRDPVDASKDADLLALALERRAEEACGGAYTDGGPRDPDGAVGARSDGNDPEAPGADRLLTWRTVRDLTGISRMTAWRLQRTGGFPQPVRISPGRVGWRLSEVEAWTAGLESGNAG